MVNLACVTLGFVDKIANMIVKTADNKRIKLGMIKCEFLGVSSLGTNTERQTEIMIAFTDNKIFALLSAISLSL
ncbi:thymus-specific serine protease-like protein, partial [Corchorus olitorius]